jgi:hypothetical protein
MVGALLEVSFGNATIGVEDEYRIRRLRRQKIAGAREREAFSAAGWIVALDDDSSGRTRELGCRVRAIVGYHE